jgi:hypothetical protein
MRSLVIFASIAIARGSLRDNAVALGAGSTFLDGEWVLEQSGQVCSNITTSMLADDPIG